MNIENDLPHIVAFRQDADQVVVDLHENRAYILFVHECQRIKNRLERADPDQFFGFVFQYVGDVPH